MRPVKKVPLERGHNMTLAPLDIRIDELALRVSIEVPSSNVALPLTTELSSRNAPPPMTVPITGGPAAASFNARIVANHLILV
jgi:hypothetical protein